MKSAIGNTPFRGQELTACRVRQHLTAALYHNGFGFST
nr:MAG TPA: hypothetical protein [Caudoviricetes sp.]